MKMANSRIGTRARHPAPASARTIIVVGGALATFALVAGAGVLVATLASGVAALVLNGFVNPPSRYRRHGIGQRQQTLDHRHGISGFGAEGSAASCPAGDGRI
jgi:hypothetical protein